MSYPLNTAETRKQWVVDNYQRIKDNRIPYRVIAEEMKRYFGMPRNPSLATVGRYLQYAEQVSDPHALTPEALELLRAENFPVWRSRLFGYQTSKTQHALYYMLRGLAFKEDLPDWVIEHFDLPPEINDDVQEKEKLITFILLVAPRHGKTMLVVHGLINLYAINPDLRVIFCQGIATTTADIAKLIMLEMEDNDQLKTMYGPFRHDDRQWSGENGFVLARRKRHSITPSLLPVGITSNVRSRDADILIIDDPQDLDRAESEATTSKDYRKITAEFMTRREPHTPVLMIGSHLPTLFGDVFTQIEENLDNLQTEGQAIIIRKRPAHDDENCPVASGEAEEHWDCLEWPEYRPWAFLMAMKAMLGEELYLAVYQQENRIEGVKPFPVERVKSVMADGGILDPRRRWKEVPKRCLTPECRGTLYNGLGFDPAAGEGKKASYTAIVVISGCIACHTLYVVDYEEKRVSPDIHPGMVESWTRSFPEIHMVRIEINAYQKALARDPQVLASAKQNNFIIDEWITDDRKNTPEFGIPMLANYVRSGHLSVPCQTDQDREYADSLIRSLIRYPNKPNDIPMALWLAAGAVWLLWEMYANLDPIYLPGRERNVPAYMIDNPLILNLKDLGISATSYG